MMNPRVPFDEVLGALRAISEHTRLRILFLCAQSELSVGDLVEILGQSQPRISRHLKIMHTAGVLERQQEGQFAWFRTVTTGHLAKLVQDAVRLIDPRDRTHLRDMEALEHITQAWRARAEEFFRRNYSEWDILRRKIIDEKQVDSVLRKTFKKIGAQSVLDIGTGTGHVMCTIGDLIENCVGIDVSREMLFAARANVHSNRLRHCHVRHANMHDLPFDDYAFDAISMHLALHYAESPRLVLEECGRVLKEGGHLVIVDFSPHERLDLTRIHGHIWPGFSDDVMKEWLSAVGFTRVETAAISGENPEVKLWVARLACQRGSFPQTALSEA